MIFDIWNDKKHIFGTRILIDKKRRLGDGPFWRRPPPFFPDSRPTKLTLETLPPPVVARLVGWVGGWVGGLAGLVVWLVGWLVWWSGWSGGLAGWLAGHR